MTSTFSQSAPHYPTAPPHYDEARKEAFKDFVSQSLKSKDPPQEILNDPELNEIDLHPYPWKVYSLAFKTRLRASGYSIVEFMKHPELFPRGSTAEREMSKIALPVLNDMVRNLNRDWVKLFEDHERKGEVKVT